MITLLLILATANLHAPQARHAVRWTGAVGPGSRQALEAKLKRPVKLPRGQKIFEHTDTKREIRTCADYMRAKKAGWRDSANTYERSTESFFKDQCDVPLLVLAAQPSRVSYVKNFKLDEAALDLLPPSLSWIMSGDEEQAADEAERQGLSWKKFKPGLKIREKYANGMEVEEPDEATIDLEINAFGDFNGDGIEDVLLFKSTHAIKGTFRFYQSVILTRTAAGGPLKAFEVEDKEIEKAATRMSQTGSSKPMKTRRPKL
jgi:hypothetical protein